jgi:hypothetical protein
MGRLSEDARRAEFDLLRRWARLLDAAFTVPGTSITFGLDPLLGLIPGLGDLVTPVFALILQAHAFRRRVPKVVQLRMLLNVLIDSLLGAIPVVGDVFDLAWKANVRNLSLLERYGTQTARDPDPGDWVFVVAVMAALATAAVLPVVFLAWLLARFGLF